MQPQNPQFLTVLHPTDEFARKKEKAIDAIEKEQARALKELEANVIFGRKLERWQPEEREITLRYQRESVSAGSASALTASNMKRGHMIQIGLVFGRVIESRDPTPRRHQDRDPGRDELIRERLFKMGEQMTQQTQYLALPYDMRRTDFNLDPALAEFPLTGQLQRLANSIFIRHSQGLLISTSPRPSVPLQINWKEDDQLGSTDEEALGILFNIAHPGRALSELVVERTTGSFLQSIFHGIEDTDFTTGQTMKMFGALSAYGCHPRPDLLARATGSVHRLLNPVCFVGESKTQAKHNSDTLAQLVTAAHSTLVLFIFAWCLRHPRCMLHNIKLPEWAIIPGVIYTEYIIEIYAFHPRAGVKWEFVSTPLSRHMRDPEEGPSEKLRLWSVLRVVQDQARIFRNGMKGLLEEVFDYSTRRGLSIRAGIIADHSAEERQKLKDISKALTESMSLWETLFPASDAEVISLQHPYIA